MNRQKREKMVRIFVILTILAMILGSIASALVLFLA
jgi:hypothetical protein